MAEAMLGINGEIIRYAISERANYRQLDEMLDKTSSDSRIAAD